MILYRGHLYRRADYLEQLDQVYLAMKDLLVRYNEDQVDFAQYRKELAALQARENKLVFRDVK